MCFRPSQVIPERASRAFFKKGNEPEEMELPIFWKPCACGDGFVARSPGNSVWHEAKKVGV